MSVQELKAQFLSLPRNGQDEVIAFLFQARHAEDEGYQRDVARRLEDRDPTHWLTRTSLNGSSTSAPAAG